MRSPTQMLVDALQANVYGPPAPPRELPAMHNGPGLHDIVSAYSKLFHAQYDPLQFLGLFGAKPKREGGASSVNPLTRSGLENLAGILFAGSGRGGKLSPIQQQFLDQLGGKRPLESVDDPFAPGVRHTLPQTIWEKPDHYGLGPGGIPATSGGERIISTYVRDHPELEPIARLLGYTTGDPGVDQWNIVHKQGENLGYLKAKLGETPGSFPDYMGTRSQIGEWDWRRDPADPRYPARDQIDRQIMDGERLREQVDNQAAIARIIDTILRRRQSPSGGDTSFLGPFGQN